MRRIKTIANVFVVLFLVVLLLKHFLIDKSYVPQKSDYSANLEEIRKLANDTTGLPVKINSLIIADGELLNWTIIAGDYSINNKYIQTSFQLVFDNYEILIDMPMNKEQFDDFKYGKNFYEDKYCIWTDHVMKAEKIMFTHEHGDHIGSLCIASNINSLYNKVIMTKEQIKSPFINESGIESGVLDKITPVFYDKYHIVAPGVVLIKSPGHTPGHQMIYVKLQNSEEYLFAGDIVWNMANIERCKNRPLLAILFGKEDRDQLGHLIK